MNGMGGSHVAWAEGVIIDGGAGDDVLQSNVGGVQMTGGTGADTFYFSAGSLVTDAIGEDTFSFFGVVPSLALSYAGSEAVWATSLFGLMRFAYNTAGEMVVNSPIFGNGVADQMYFANPNKDALAGALAELARGPFKDKHVKLVLPYASGKPHVEDLHALLARAAASETRAE